MTDNFEGIQSSEKIAIVGMAGRFPSARNVAQFWKLLASERMGTRWFTESEMRADGVPAKDLSNPNYVRAANFLTDMENFDAGFFGFSPREASILDPQHRHFLECAWEALEDAGHMPEQFDGSIGVFAGSGMQAYLPLNILTNPDLVEEIGMFLLRHTGNDKDFLTTRLSYLLNLQGPSVAVQTACSTSLVAVHQAAASLLSMECDMAIAGGVTVELPHRHGYIFEEGEVQSPDGLCRPFDDDSQGTVFGSGAALVVLRRLEDAIADGDDIRAVLLGSAINNDGAQKAGYLAPSVDGQAEAAAEALAIAGVPAETIGYIEAHGTGTPVGDPIELAGLAQAYGGGGTGFCGIGSVKSNVGHLDTAAGTTSLIKVVEAMRHNVIPASLHYRTPNSRFDLQSSPFYVVDQSKEWQRSETPRRAGINSLGVGGTNAHAIVEEAPERLPVDTEECWRLLPFSARNMIALDGLQDKWRDFVGSEDMPSLADAAYTLRNGRREFSERRTIVAKDTAGLSAALWQETPTRIATGSATGSQAEIVFMFPGGGAQYPGAGSDLLETSLEFKKAVEECFANMPDIAPKDLYSVMFEKTIDDESARGKLEMSGYAIPALFILEYAYARMWQGWGVFPSAILGHSAGEYAGAVIANVMSVADALKIVVWRGKVMDAAAAGAMSMIPAPLTKVSELIGDTLDIAALNAPGLCVVSGEIDRIDALEMQLKGTEFEATRIRINVAAHSRILDNQLENFRDGISEINLKQPEIPFVSSLRGDWSQEDDFSTVDYWVSHLRHTVLFADAVETILRKPGQILLEVGPGKTLGPLAEMSHGEHKPVAVIASGRPPKEPENDMVTALNAAGSIWANGGNLEWDKLPGAKGQRVSLPTYAFAKDRHWIEPGSGVNTKEAEETEPAIHLKRIANPDNWFLSPSWNLAPIPPAEPNCDTSWLLFVGEDAVSEALIQKLRARREKCFTVRTGDGFSQDGCNFQIAAGRAEDYEALLKALPEMPSNIVHCWPMGTQGITPQSHVFDSAFLLCRALQAEDPEDLVRLSFLGTNALSVVGEQVQHPELGTLLGPVRVAPREIPSLVTQYLDFEEAEQAPWVAEAIIEEHDGETAEDAVAFRGRKRFKQEFNRLNVPAMNDLPDKMKINGRYVITGGTGGIGLELAKYLGHTAKARIALISRQEMPDSKDWAKVLKREPESNVSEAINIAKDVKSAGGEVLFVSADVSDSSAIAAAIDTVRANFGGVDGLFHGAGTMDDAPMMVKSVEDAHKVMSAKVVGGEHLANLFPQGTLDFFAVFSSTSVITAPPGQVDYVAANSYLEALAASREDGIAVSWGVWRDVGMASRAYNQIEHQSLEAHPLLGYKEVGEDGAISFTALYDPSDLWVINEHVVGGIPVLPGTAYIEIACAAMDVVSSGRKWEIQSLSLVNPMIFPENLRARVVITLIPDDQGYELRIQSTLSAEAPLVEHCRAQIVIKRLNDRKIPRDLQRMSNLLRSESSGQDSQEDLIDFGPRWDNVGEIRIGDREIEADFALSETFLSDLDAYNAHPGLTDTAATIGLNLLPDVGSEGAFYAPMSVDRIRFLKPLPQRFVTRAKLVAETPGRFASFDVVFLDEQGAPLLILEGFALRRVEGDSFDWHNSPELLFDVMIAQGICARESNMIFSRMLNIPERQMVVSPTSMKDLVREMLKTVEPRRKKPQKSTEKSAAVGASYANPVEEKMASLWSDLLGVDQPVPEADFFDLGGHSLAAVRLFAKIRKEFLTDLPLATLFQSPTLRSLSDVVIDKGNIILDETETTVEKKESKSEQEWSPLVQIKEGSATVKPLYLVHGAGGNVLNFRSLSGYIDPKLPFYALRALGSDGGSDIHETIEDMAECYVSALLKQQPEGPYNLAGYSGGGVIAFEMAQQLQQKGFEIGNLIYFDSMAPDVDPQKMSIFEKIWMARHWSLSFALNWPVRKWRGRHAGRENTEIKRYLDSGETIPDELLGRRMTQAYLAAENRYSPNDYAGDILLFKGAEASVDFLRAGPDLGWGKWVSGNIEIQEFECDHFNMMIDPTIGEIGKILNELLVGK
ncbi:SDR family NAD(P)-dependent oxidoreductase [Sneathiella marina]|uniref:SDR family NAD(P)-dependent oxidoreductase n=1 Tax=Sneathiella marina TaxID=2950108 RepID=A0ABY4VYJ2_9PROT|nr:type I polyketide synthase [Sneathiella marina]USG59767.1 SDR family NAD(P)-dependent oxidoreductase [Sneathiella marina]